MSNELTDHDMILRIHNSIYEKDTGLKDCMKKVNVLLLGNGKEGIVSRVSLIEKEHKEEKEARARREQRLLILAGILSGAITYITDKIFRW